MVVGCSTTTTDIRGEVSSSFLQLLADHSCQMIASHLIRLALILDALTGEVKTKVEMPDAFIWPPCPWEEEVVEIRDRNEQQTKQKREGVVRGAGVVGVPVHSVITWFVWRNLVS
jgi:hypothetical protein